VTGRELRRIRARLGLTQQQMAKRLDLSRNTVSRYEAARRVERWLEYAVLYLKGRGR
jgi:transcriptional regulator with XRE-family HTH domain